MNINDLKVKLNNSKDLYQNFSRRKHELVPFSSLKDEVIIDIYQLTDQYIIIITENGYLFNLHHEHECCEHVYIDDVCGDLECCTGLVVLSEEAQSKGKAPKGYDPDNSVTWTFYKLDTINDNVTIKFFGISNGYYSEIAQLHRYSLNDFLV